MPVLTVLTVLTWELPVEQAPCRHGTPLTTAMGMPVTGTNAR